MTPQPSGEAPQTTPVQAKLPPVSGQVEIKAFQKASVSMHSPAVVRARLAYNLYWLLAGVVAVLFLFVGIDIAQCRDWSNLKDLFSLVLTPIATLAGTAFGFFFANIASNDE